MFKTNFLFQFNLVEIGIRSIRVEHFIAVHHRHEVLGVGKVDDVVGIAWEHDDGLYLVATHLVVNNLICAFLAELD